MLINQIKVDDIRCVSCDSRSIAYVGKLPLTNRFAGRTIPFLVGGGGLYACSECGMLFRYPRMREDELIQAYQEGKSDWSHSIHERNDWSIVRELLAKTLNAGKILDVGCFDGEFLNSLSDSYIKYGVEVNPRAADKARSTGIKVISSNMENLSSINELFDAIVAIDVIEHTVNPMKFLSEISERLVTGGTCIISTGNTAAWSWRIMGSSYWYCANPEHISFINIEWCRKAGIIFGLEITDQKFFSYRNGGAIRKLSDAAKNITYKAMPSLFSYLRRSGYGNRDSSKHDEVSHYPPTWLTAKDHFSVALKKI